MSVEELEEIIRVNERKLLQMLAESNMLQSKILMNNIDLFSVDSSDPKRHKG